ncbi:MAG: hypothetical protein A2Z25_14330 [Planctomycetes bacterium RBG_16_55_9]|nr:MAG: hypothetical protein A2Z25_14330 [Planctomycetes bacterium RBG_16_55_9]
MKQSKIKMLVKKLNVRPCAEMYGRTLTEILEAQETGKNKSAARRPSLWRFIMESKVTRYSAAAVIVLALTLVLLSPFGAPGNGSVVLADVQKKVADIETMILRGTKTFTYPGEPGRVFEFDGMKCKFDIVKYHSTQYGLVEEGYAEGQLFYRITFNIPEKQTLILFPKYKKYLKFASMDAFAKAMESLGTPNGILDLLLAGDYKKLGRDKIDGIEAEGFEFQDTTPFAPIKELLPKAVFNIQSFKGKVWIGIEEQLPVRVEGDLAISKSFMSMFHELNLHEVNTFGDYNIDLDENIFNTNVPEGYTELTLSDILSAMPVQAKAGLVGLGILPAGLVFWKRRKRKRATAHPS